MATATKTKKQNIAQELLTKQRAFFRTGETKNVDFRIKKLKLLKKAITAHEEEIYEALKQDFGKPVFETYVSEIGMVLEEIGLMIKNLPNWSDPEKVDTPITIHPGSSYIYRVPYGVTLVIGAWNYPFNLTLTPVVGAIAAGNCVIMKPSELSPHTSAIITKIIGEIYEEDFVAVVEGSVKETQELLAEKFDFIFFTGSTRVGKIVAEAAAKHLTPTTLELGGKSPCIVAKDADLAMTAKRIVWGKFLNAGQTCIAPDYLLVHENVKAALIFKMKECVKEFYGNNPEESPDFPRIINKDHFKRLSAYLEDGNAVVGGNTIPADLYIAPTILDNIDWEDEVMQDEIFGPILPVITFTDMDEIVEKIKDLPTPLSLYIFTEKKSLAEKLILDVEFGGGCVNDTVTHFANPNLPFGGVGNSGVGAYHGKFSFDTFSHHKGIHKKSTWLDVPLRYPPYEEKVLLVKTIVN
jgi:aldehyde dehydrogenase (NAD+)